MKNFIDIKEGDTIYHVNVNHIVCFFSNEGEGSVIDIALSKKDGDFVRLFCEDTPMQVAERIREAQC